MENCSLAQIKTRLIAGDVSCHLVQIIFFTVLPVVCVCVCVCVKLAEIKNVDCAGIRMLRRIFEPE
jgi:hypothetical protein